MCLVAPLGRLNRGFPGEKQGIYIDLCGSLWDLERPMHPTAYQRILIGRLF